MLDRSRHYGVLQNERKTKDAGRNESRMYSATTIAKMDQNRRELALLYRTTE